MAIGPFDSFAFPGVYTRTLTEAPRAVAAGDIRVPAFIGVAADTVPVNNYEMIRGSSSMADNPVIKENVSAQILGTNRNFTVSMKPVVSGDGTGTVTNDPSKIIVYVNGNPVPVASLNGTTGEVYLVDIPALGDEVLVTYYYKRTDTLHENEDLSDQIDGVTTTFQVHNYPIVSGDNSGITTTDPTKITVKINGATVSVLTLNGDAGQFTLATAPSVGDVLTVTYYTNEEQNTSDILPSPYVDSIIRVGYSPGTSDFVEGTDFILDTTTFGTTGFSTIQWGNSFKIIAGSTTIGYTPIDSSKITGTLYDNWVWRRPASGVTDGTNRSFVIETLPVNGTGRAKETEDPANLWAYVGNNPVDATQVPILTVTPSTKTITLATAPAAGANVYVTQYANMLTTDTWTIDCLTSGGTGTGTYSITGTNTGTAMNVSWSNSDTTVADPDFATENVTYPNGTGPLNSDAQVVPGYAVEETVFLTFHDATSYIVTSSSPSGTGTKGDNTGYLNQTYIDSRTGFRVTIRKGTTVDYTNGDVIGYKVSPVITTSSTPVRVVPGIRLTVDNMTDVNPGDTGLVNTYNLIGANEPNVGDFYYVSFNETKQFDSNGIGKAKLYINENDVLADTGDLTIDNRIGLAANLAFLNGAPAVVLLQIKKTAGGIDAPDSRYNKGIDYFNEPMEGGLRPTLIQPVTTSTAVINYLKVSNSIQSGIRYGNEHRSYFGFPLNTTPSVAQARARAINNERMVAVYPDGAIITITDALGVETEYLVDGAYLAAAVAGRDTSPAFDVAEPLTKKPIVGFKRLYRRMDSVTSAQTANAGITLIEEAAGGMNIKFALTTDTSSVLTRTPSIVRVKDFIQRGARSILTPYIGTKMLVQRMTEIENTLNSYMASLQQAQIVTAFQPAKAKQDENDPSIVNVTLFYSPVPELLWIMVTFNLRSAV